MRGKRLKMPVINRYLIVCQHLNAISLAAGCFAQKNEKKRENSTPLLFLPLIANF